MISKKKQLNNACLAHLELFKRCLRFRSHIFLFGVFITSSINCFAEPIPPDRQEIKALFLPIADHYAAIVAHDRYRHEMKYADFQLHKMQSWNLLKAYFYSEESDMAFVMSPLAMQMYHESPRFRWIGLMHRDGNALVINELLERYVELAPGREYRKPDEKVAEAFAKFYAEENRPIEIGMPHLLATHTVILYQYLKERGIELSIDSNADAEVLAIAVPPQESPAFIRGKNNRAQPTAFEQSLPWGDIVEADGIGKIAWYSKDVLPSKHGHVECIVIATDESIREKTKAVNEVMSYIHQAGRDIEQARDAGGEKMELIVETIRKYIPAHTRESIITSLDPELRVINYEHLNVDMQGLKQIMDLAVESGILKREIDIEAFADTRFRQGAVE